MALQNQEASSIYRRMAIWLSLIWVVVIVWFFVRLALGQNDGILFYLLAGLIALIVPIALLWGLERLAEERSIDGMRLLALETDLKRRDTSSARTTPETGEVKAMRARIAALSERVTLLEAEPEEAPELPPEIIRDPEPELPIFEPPGDVVLSRHQIVRALNFPVNAQDSEGFDLLRQALASRELAQLLQAAEDCLDFLSQKALFMDDLLIAPASSEDWRAFAKGGRVRAALLPMHGIQDEAALAQVQTQMRSDPIFRDAALILQRRFDGFLTEFALNATDSDLLDLMNTRSGRAFILFAQVSGSLTA